MTCQTCIKYEPKNTENVWISGCSNFKKYALDKHNTSKNHTDYERQNKAEQAEPGTSTAEKSLTAMNSVVQNRIKRLFRNAHALAKHSRPYTDYNWICKLDITKELDVGQTYTNEKACVAFIHYIANTERKITTEILENAPFFSLISDGSTDSSRQEAEILYVRAAHQGHVKTRFVGIKNVAKADADGIVHAVKQLMNNSYSDWQAKIVGYAADGASVMQGIDNGVITKLRNDTCSEMVNIHCTAHRLELAFKDSVKGVKLYEKADAALLGLYLFYRNSPLNRANLKNSFEACGMSMLLPTRVGGTRWVPHTKRALSNVLTGYKCIIQHLERLRNPDGGEFHKDAAQKAKYFLGVLCEKSCLQFMFFLWDIVEALCILSETLQRRDISIGEVWTVVEATKSLLTTYIDNNGPKLSMVIDTDEHEGTVLKGTNRAFVGVRKNLLESLIEKLDRRFGTDVEFLKATNIVQLKQWPVQDSAGTYGDHDIAILSSKFSQLMRRSGLDPYLCVPEWFILKQYINNCSFDMRQDLSWISLNQSHGNSCRNVLGLVDLILSLPATSVEAERGFSQMKLVKSDWRNSLTDAHLSDLLLVKLESPDIESFDPTPAFSLWQNGGTRRPTFMDDEPVVDDSFDDEGVLTTTEEDISEMLAKITDDTTAN